MFVKLGSVIVDPKRILYIYGDEDDEDTCSIYYNVGESEGTSIEVNLSISEVFAILNMATVTPITLPIRYGQSYEGTTLGTIDSIIKE